MSGAGDNRNLPRPVWLAGLAWGLFAASRLSVAVAAGGPEGATVLWVWAPWWLVILVGLAAKGLTFTLWRWQVVWLRGRGLDQEQARQTAAECWWPSLAILLLPLLELCFPLYSYSLAPLALCREAWPLAVVACLGAVVLHTYHAAPRREAPARPRRWLGWAVFLGALVVFALMGFRLSQVSAQVGRFMGGDEPQYLFNAHTLAVDHDLDLVDDILLRESRYFLPPYRMIGGHGRWSSTRAIISKHRPGLPLLLSPFYAWGMLLGVGVRKLCVVAVWLLGAWMALEVFRLGREQTGSQAAGLLGAAAAAMTLPGLHYANLLFSEMGAAAFAVAGFAMIRRLRPGQVGRALLAGVVVGYLAWFQERFILLSVLLGLYFLYRGLWRDWRSLAAFLLPCVISAGIMMYYFQMQYGIPLPTVKVHARGSYLNPRGLWEGLSGIFVDAAEGLWPYGALWIASLAGLGWLVRRRPSDGVWTAVMALATYLTAGLYTDWFGGINPPSRYLVAAVPFLALGLAAGWRWGAFRFRLAVLVLGVASLLSAVKVFLYPSAVYGHRVVLDADFQFPLLSDLLPTYLLSLHSHATNFALGAVWMAAALLLVAALLAGPRRPSPRGTLAGLLAAMLLCSGFAVAADGLSGRRLAPTQPSQTLSLWRRLAALPAGGARWLAVGDRKGLDRALAMPLPPVRYRHPPAKPISDHLPAVQVPPGGVAKLVVWGQYLDLPAGRYRLVARLSSPYHGPDTVAWLDVSADTGRRVLVKREVSGAELGRPLVLEFALSAPAARVECRVGTTGRRPFAVKDMFLLRLPPAASGSAGRGERGAEKG